MSVNKTISNPAMIKFVEGGNKYPITRVENRLAIPIDARWNEFQTAIKRHIGIGDSVIVTLDDNINLDADGARKAIDIKLRGIKNVAYNMDKFVLSPYKDKWYLMNPPFGKDNGGKGYVPQDAEVLERFNSYESEEKWQKHQGEILDRMAQLSPLSEGEYRTPNHVAVLTNPSRGLAREDIEDFWSWKSNQDIMPTLVGDDMLGVPGVLASSFDGFTMIPQKGPNKGVEVPLTVLNLKTMGAEGIMIPMANVNGDVAKYQVASDIKQYNVRLKARHEDGVSIRHDEIYDKTTYKYLFDLNGDPSNLHVESVDNGVVTFVDTMGAFTASMKEDVKETLINRGYDIPEIIDTLRVDTNAKYMWMSPGMMTGASKKTQDIVTPSNAGFIVAREPKESNEKQDYVVVVTEGALKGHIVAKYLNSPDENGKSVGDFIAKDSGIVVAQVPGVSKAFVSSVVPVYDKFNVKGTYIAMDADGRTNLSVARGIKTATELLSKHSPTKVMSWDPKHKGLDDALIAVGRHSIKMEDMDIHFGTPEKLFPLDKATPPNPYKLDGTRSNKQAWVQEYGESVKKNEAKLKSVQAETAKRAQEVQDAGKDLAEILPTEDDVLQQ